MIRPLGASDMDAVLRIWKASNLQAHAFVSSEYWERNAEFVRKAMSEAEVWIYESGGRIIGFVGLTGDHIAGIFVEMECRSRGIGHALLSFLKERHRNLVLHVFEKNNRAVSFYRREGFECRDRHVEEGTGEMEWTMEWTKENNRSETASNS